MHRPVVAVTTEWSGIRFPAPVALVRRDQVKVGDRVQSSHGYTGVVVKASKLDRENSVVALTLELHKRGSGRFQSERYDGNLSIPVLDFAEVAAPDAKVLTVMEFTDFNAIRTTAVLADVVDLVGLNANGSSLSSSRSARSQA